jgi:hypothetical protein
MTQQVGAAEYGGKKQQTEKKERERIVLHQEMVSAPTTANSTAAAPSANTARSGIPARL